MSSNYDGQDQAYQDLLVSVSTLAHENEMLSNALQEIAALIRYQASLADQDRWLANIMELGLYTLDEEE